ncbi:MAG: hypothetical protein WC796_03925 [Candidatus Pacearchaeota archaeon]|jgi:hypothetical protein
MPTKKNKQFRSIRYATRLGITIQEKAREISSAYRAGISIRMIAHGITMSGIYKGIFPENISQGVLENAVLNALKGNYNPINGPTYKGLIPLEEYSTISARNRKNARINGTKRTINEKLGFLSLDPKDHRENARASARSRGRTPWMDDELLLTLVMRDDQNQQYHDIAVTLNNQYHDSRAVRTENTVREALRRIKGKKSK